VSLARVIVAGWALAAPIEAAVLFFGLDSAHPRLVRAIAGPALTACTYPVLVLVVPALIDPAWSFAAYATAGEVSVVAAECALFFLAVGRRASAARGALAIVAANAASFVAGEIVRRTGIVAPLLGG